MGFTNEEMISEVPVVEINRDNLVTFWPSIILNVRSSSFLALDVELSGLGDRKKLNAKSIDDRYKSVSEAAMSRSVVSLGLCCFTKVDQVDDGGRPREATGAHVFKSQTYNVLTLCDDDYTVEPGAVKFLVEHGFDFNLQYAKGLPYRRGRGRQKTDEKTHGLSLGCLFKEILSSRKPVVFHNGFIDLIFLYGNLVADLPTSLQTFVADVAELFPAGVYDTKFVADYRARYTASYLEYVFRKCQRENQSEATAGRPHIDVRLPRFLPNMEKWLEWAACGVLPAGRSGRVDNLCPVFLSHGWCKEGRLCSLSHDVDAILDLEEMKASKKRARRRRRREQQQDVVETNGTETTGVGGDSCDMEHSRDELLDGSMKSDSNCSGEGKKSLPRYTGSHRAGYDAFMTAFSLSYFVLKLNQWPSGEEFDAPSFKNQISLSGKDYPLHLRASSFSKPSQYVKEFLKGLF